MPAAPPGQPSRAELLILGGSVRFLAASCHRAGWSVHACDRFGDADLLAISSSYLRLPANTHEALPLVAAMPLLPFLFTGGLENAPSLLKTLARTRQAASASAEAVAAVRDGATLARAATAAGLTVPETHNVPTGVPTDGSFLVKPQASVGGRGISPWHGGPCPATPSRWQRFHDGTPHGVSVLLTDGRPPILLGVSRDVRHRDATAAPGRAYAGSVTVQPEAWIEPLLSLASLLAARHGLRGAVGIDCIVEDSGRAVLLEVNPRPTASMELIERTQGISIAAEHLTAFGLRSPRCPAAGAVPLPAHSGKAILFAHQPLVVSMETHAAITATVTGWHHDAEHAPIADIPQAGTAIEAGHPVLTVFADGDSSEAVDDLLASRLEAIRTQCFSQPSDEASLPRQQA
jgi:predicted ATP-grasp superfamily ATP-dependent carboligase